MHAGCGRVGGDALEELNAGLARERSDRCLFELCGDSLGVRGMPVPERAHGDATEEVEDGVPVDVDDRTAVRVVHGEARRDGVILRARGQMLVFTCAQRLA